MGSRKDAVDGSKKVVGRSVRLNAEGVKKLLLCGTLLFHHPGVTRSLVGLSLQATPGDGGSPSFLTK